MRKLAALGATATLVILGYGAVFHMTSLSGRLGLSGGGCPFAVGQSASQREQLRRAAAAKLRGGLPALSQPALGFDLGAETRDRISAWLRRVGGHCAEAQLSDALECKIADAGELPGSLLQGPATVFFTFNDRSQLRAVQVMVTVQDPDAAATVLRDIRAQLEKDLHMPARVVGEASSEYLSGGALRQALTEFRFSNYYASLRATNMGSLGYYAVSQTYQSLAD